MSLSSDLDQTNEDVQSFVRTHPLSFELLNDEDQNQIFIVDDDKPASDLHLRVTNNSEQNIELPEFIPGANSDQYHFELIFRPGTLALAQNISTLQMGWNIKADKNTDDTFSVRLTYEIGLTLHSRETQIITLQNVRANNRAGAHQSHAEFKIGWSTELTIEERLTRIDVINRRGRKDLPLHIGFLGSNTVLNDGKTSNTIRLRLANILKEHEIQFNDDCHPDATRLVFRFDSGESKDWALGSDSEVENIEVSVKQPGWSVRGDFEGETPEWILSCNRDIHMEAGKYIEIEFTGIVSSIRSGLTYLHISYENIPGYWDGRIVQGLEKTPIMYRDVLNGKGKYTGVSHVGIGTDSPNATLDVNGLIKTRLPYSCTESEKFRVEGSDQVFYPVYFWDDAWDQGGLELEVLRPNTHQDGMWQGSLMCQIQCHSSCWGHESDYWIMRVFQAAHGYHHFIGGYETHYKNRIHILWLRGNFTYFWRSNHPAYICRIDTEYQKPEYEWLEKYSLNRSTRTAGQIPADFNHLNYEISHGPEYSKTTARIHDAQGEVMPRGGIIMWSGPENQVPAGWAICNGQTIDGTLTTPDLRDRFIMGSRADIRPGSYGNADSTTIPSSTTSTQGDHTHMFPSHWYMNHSPDGNRSRTFVDAGGLPVDDSVTTRPSGGHSHTVPSHTFSTGRPKWFALCFIMKK